MTPVRSRLAAPHSLRASGDRWLFGYADVVTLLFACFAALYATQAKPAKATERSEVPASSPIAPDISPALQAVVARHTDVRVELAPNASGLVISIPETGSFAPGRADLSPAAIGVFTDLAAALRTQPYPLRIEGHTDDVPINTVMFPSNWALSSARATRVVQFLLDEGGLPADRLSTAAYAEHRPRVANTSAVARARNRRVDIVVIGAASAPQAPGAGADYSKADLSTSGKR